ncbi:MAG: hypothetical protein ACPF95_03870, partial [Flavobacteriaceae bacterium]
TIGSMLSFVSWLSSKNKGNPVREALHAFCIPIWGMFVTNKDLHLLQNFYSEDKNTKKNS